MQKNNESAFIHLFKAGQGKRYAALLMASVVVAVPSALYAQAADSGAPVAAKADTAKSGAAAKRSFSAPVCAGELAPTATMNVPEGKSGVLNLPQLNVPAPAWLRSVGDMEVVQVEPITSPKPRNMFFLFGKKVGSTNLMFQNKEGRCAMVEVSVGVDTAAVQASLVRLMPSEKDITVSMAADSLVISGTASDAIAVDKIMTIAGAHLRKSGTTGKPADRIVNMMSVGAPQQVMLEVKVAEISKTLIDKLGASLFANKTKGSWTFGVLSNFLSGNGSRLTAQNPTSGELLAIEADKKDGLVKILAEPTVMAISGQDGSFLAGGKIFIPVAQDSNGKITLEEKEFGVGLRFTPTVLEGGRINLKVAPEVSELSRDGIGLSAAGIGANAILPLITTRRAATTVQLFDGQSFAIGGLIKNNITENIRALPVLGEVPILGALFRSSDFQSDRTELVFIVTPRLVKPLPANYPLPTDHFIEPTRGEFFLHGKMEGTLSQPKATTPTGFELK